MFDDRTEAAGLDFVHVNGMTGRFYQPEITGSGVALFDYDYDNDGDLDIFLVQGGTLEPGPPRRARRCSAGCAPCAPRRGVSAWGDEDAPVCPHCARRQRRRTDARGSSRFRRSAGGDGVRVNPHPAADRGSNPLQGVNAGPSCAGCGRVFRPTRRNQRHGRPERLVSVTRHFLPRKWPPWGGFRILETREKFSKGQEIGLRAGYLPVTVRRLSNVFGLEGDEFLRRWN